jgi:hypothetical protein
MMLTAISMRALYIPSGHKRELPHRGSAAALLEYLLSGGELLRQRQGNEMFLAIIITFALITGLAHAFSGGTRGGAITRRPYNNRYNDASGAREDAHV